MYIKEVTIDGFKSYAQRVTLPSFDPGFNAITGLNGSGKSNILDAICFVLGIKNLAHVSSERAASAFVGGAAAVAAGAQATPPPPTHNTTQCIHNTPPYPTPPNPHRQQTPTHLKQVRAGSLQELVYKQGSAGVTKASASITFHNDDPRAGPSGYEDREFITVTRQVCARC